MRQFNETFEDISNKPRFFIGKVEAVDANYVITFSIPDILENIAVYPTAYPRTTDHIKEVKVGDSVLVEQLDINSQFFTYSPMNLNNNTGMYFGKVMVDITDGNTIIINTQTCRIVIDGKKNHIFIGNDKYSFNKFVKDFEEALKNLHTEGGENLHTAESWYQLEIMPIFKRLKQIFNSD